MKRFSWGKQGMCEDSHGMWTTCDELAEATALLNVMTADRDAWLQVSRDWRTRAEAAEAKLRAPAQPAAPTPEHDRAETRKALEESQADVKRAHESIAGAAHCLGQLRTDLESTRADLAKAEARVKKAARITLQLQESFEVDEDGVADNDLLALDMGRILEALRG